MENEKKNVKRFALLAWLLAAGLFTLATWSTQTESDGARVVFRMGSTVGAPVRGS